jgi:hypothetical protein
MWNFSNQLDFPETAEYLEAIIPEDLDLPTTWAPAIPFKFRWHTDSKGSVEVIPGIKINRNKEYKIECKPDLNMKPDDKIRFYNSDLNKYTITDIDTIISEKYKNEHDFKVKT